ncbi:hypothetical protein [Nocardioides convexus]|uniref:hypothetical protein n=1 Tax=Nocardioides convexus TaxID=2712224 RepID=UPI002418657C|nr:hypothetical protein [Nocardioides convexus]
MADAITWAPDDPRLPALADRFVAMVEDDAARSDAWEEGIDIPDDLAALLDGVFLRLGAGCPAAAGPVGGARLARVDQAWSGSSPRLPA